MKSKNIIVGEQYLVGYRPATVLETMLERQTWRSSRKDGVRVSLVDHNGKTVELMVPSSDVVELWATHQAERDAQERRRKVAEQDRERMKSLGEVLEGALAAKGVEMDEWSIYSGYGNQDGESFNSLTLNEEAVVKLIAVLGKSKTAKPKQHKADFSSSQDLADLLG
jgi:hypothetical protein